MNTHIHVYVCISIYIYGESIYRYIHTFSSILKRWLSHHKATLLLTVTLNTQVWVLGGKFFKLCMTYSSKGDLLSQLSKNINWPYVLMQMCTAVLKEAIILIYVIKKSLISQAIKYHFNTFYGCYYALCWKSCKSHIYRYDVPQSFKLTQIHQHKQRRNYS